MKRRKLATYLTLSFCLILSLNSAAQNKKLSRAESFWGLHFDKHSEINDEHIGATLTEKMLDSLIQMTRPDYIQVDTKGHPGVSSYPTKIGQTAKSYDKDPLKLIRKVTNKYNVALYGHYSGVMDINYASQNPSEARIDILGNPDKQRISFYGNYANSLLLPQIKEIASKYELDGIWVDGECWAVEPDYSSAATEDFKRMYKSNVVTVSKSDPNYKNLLEFTRKNYLKYLKNYTDQIHSDNPGFQVCSNWAFSAMMPDSIPEDLNIDFLSGDLTPDRAISAANWYGRSLAGQGKPFDLMAWSFVHPNTPKTAIQLRQEAAAVISQGSGFQIYFRQNQDLSFQPSAFHIMKEVADFVIPRREFCKDIQVIPQVGLFFSTAGWKNLVDEVYKPVGFDDIRGVLDALMDVQESVELLKSHQLKSRINEFPLIVIPNWEILEDELITQIKKYVYEGGRLLIVGPESAKYFYDILNVKARKDGYEISQPIGYNGSFANITGSFREVKTQKGATEFAYLYQTTDARFKDKVAASYSQYGSGYVGAIYVEAGKSYYKTSTVTLRKIIKDLIEKLSPPDILVKVNGSHNVHVVTSKKDEKLLIQLVNTSGEQSNTQVQGVEEIPAVKNLKISISVPSKPTKVSLQPDNEPLEFVYEEGSISILLPELEIHYIIEIKFQ